jgi:HPt (histidine-containing phosphotransfer) domain-containing protein
MAGGNEAFVAEMVGIFVRTLQQGREDLNHAMAQDNRDAAAQVAHRLLPSVSSMGLKDLQLLLEHLEEDHTRQPSEAWKQCILRINGEAELILSELSSFEQASSQPIHPTPR